MKTTDYEYWSPESMCYNRSERKPSERKMVTKRYSGVSLFCESTSIRGMAKIAKSQTRFLKMLWLLFIVFMTGGLFASATLLVLDFLNYDVGVHTSNLEIASEFPALTICHHHPFSRNAYRLWQQNRVVSPSRFNKRLRKLAKAALLENRIEAAFFAFFYDSMDVFYQNLPYSDVIELGHNWTAYRNCMSIIKETLTYEVDCTAHEFIAMKRLSHSKYFNCYTFEPISKQIAEDVDIFAVVVSMGPRPNYTHFEQAFLMDIFEQARGLRVVVHERGSLPDMERDGIHIEPGKFTEINYQPVIWDKLNTPRKPCENSNRTFDDLGRRYRYDSTQCESFYNQQLNQKKCKCIFARIIRPNFPSEKLPYCGNIKEDVKELDKRIECLGELIVEKVKRNKQPDEDGAVCLPRCQFYEFQNQISITKWRATHWQLYWMRAEFHLLNALKDKHDLSNSTLNISSTPEFEKLLRYYDSDNLTRIDYDIKKSDIFSSDENFAYVRLKRKSNVAVIKKEKLILSLNVLLSRIGGLCSLSIGLTTAFVVEIIEFLYLYCRAEANYVPDVKVPKAASSSGAFIDRKDEVFEFSMFDSPRAQMDLYGTKNGRLGPHNRSRMFRADYRVPTDTSKIKFRKDSSTSAYVG